jgi:O-antigen/teichoic acid export membrane protein
LDLSMVESVAWTGAARSAMQALSWLATIVVARLLAPSDYGLMSMAALQIGALRIFSEFGISSTVIVLRELSARSLAQLNGLAMLAGGLACGVSLLFAPLAARFFQSPRLMPVIMASSVGFVLLAPRIVPAALLRRELQFKRLAVIDASGAAVQTLTTVAGVLLGFGVWALVAGPLASQAFSSIAIGTQRRVRFERPRREGLQAAMTFTRHQLTSSMLWYGYSSADFLTAGKVLGERALGIYYLAWNLSKAIPEKLTGLIVTVMPSYLSAVQDDDAALRRYLLKLTEVISLVAFPALVGVALVAGSIEADVLGQRWAGIAGPLRILALHSVLTSIAPLPGRVLTVRRETRFLLRMDVLLAATLIPGFLIGSRWGVIGIAIAWILIFPIFQAAILGRTCRVISLPLRGYLDSLSPAASMTTVMALVVAGVLSATSGLPGLARLATAIVAGIATYVSAGLLLHRARLRLLLRALRDRRNPSPLPPSASRHPEVS